MKAHLYSKRGRPRKELDYAMFWLKQYLSTGPKLAREILAVTKRANFTDHIAHRTLLRAKKELGIKSQYLFSDWFWYLESVPGQVPKSTQIEEVAESAVSEEEFIEPWRTPQMTRFISWQFQHRDINEAKLLRELIEECRLAPADPPYPESYLRELVAHVCNGKPKPALPPGITEENL